MRVFTAVDSFRDEVHGRVKVAHQSTTAYDLKVRTQQGASYPKSPNGHSWGYEGSGPAQLALDMLWEVYGKEPSNALLQAFKRAVIARLDQNTGFRITEEEVRLFVDGYGGFVGRDE